MQLSNEQYEEIKETIASLFAEYDIRCIPINAFEVAIKMGLKIIPYSALTEEKAEAAMEISQDGFSVEKKVGEWIIYYNDHCNSYGRINHTIMHEIGHFWLGHIKDGRQEELEANFFAKYALAPSPLIHNMPGKISTWNIMNYFDLSYEAAKNAYSYYCKWLRQHGKNYRKYEAEIIDLFEVA